MALILYRIRGYKWGVTSKPLRDRLHKQRKTLAKHGLTPEDVDYRFEVDSSVTREELDDVEYCLNRMYGYKKQAHNGKYFTHESRMRGGRASASMKTHEEHSAWGRAIASMKTYEEHSAWGRRAGRALAARQTPEERSALAREGGRARAAGQTPEERSALGREGARATNAIHLRCSCGMITIPGNMSRHLKANPDHRLID
jgi:hypothetical protein